MKSLIYAVVAASVLAPVASFAQSNSSVTREQVRVELVQLQQAGYEASSRGAHYPDDIQAALQRVHARNATAQADTTGYGAAEVGSSQSGQRVTLANPTQSIYRGH